MGMGDFVPTGFPQLDSPLGGGLQRPSCISVVGETFTQVYPFIFNMLRNFLNAGLKGLYICLDRSEEEVKFQIRSFGMRPESFEERLIFLDLFSEAQKSLLKSGTLKDLAYEPDDVFNAIKRFSESLRGDFMVIDSVFTLALNIDEKTAYLLIRAIKMFTKANNLLTIGINFSSLPREIFNAIRSNADVCITIENETLHITSVWGAPIGGGSFRIDMDVDGTLDLQPLSKPYQEVMEELLRALSKANQLSVSQTLTLEVEETAAPLTPKHISALINLEEAGFVESKPYCSIVECPNCNSLKLAFYLNCPYCESILLEKGEALEHMECGHVDFRRRFEADGELRCPKCRKRLRLLGVDYRKASSIYRCSNGHVFDEAVVKFKCLKCNNTFNLEEARISTQNLYRLTDLGETQIEIFKRSKTS